MIAASGVLRERLAALVCALWLWLLAALGGARWPRLVTAGGKLV
jgi:hypothetical protein